MKLEKVPYDWLVYDEWNQVGNIQFIKRCTLVSSLTTCLFSGPVKINERILRNTESMKKTIDGVEFESNFKIDNWIEFFVSKNVILLYLNLRFNV